MAAAPEASVDRRQLTSAFGRNLRRVRQSRGFSQEAFALLAGVHRTYVGSVERGERNPSLLNIARFAEVLGVQPAELMPPLPLTKLSSDG